LTIEAGLTDYRQFNRKVNKKTQNALPTFSCHSFL